VGGFSEEFLETFLALIRRAYRRSRVAATVAYNDYIADRHHVHMNSTRWLTLTEFVKFLGREGHCKVEDTPKGWFVTYVDRDSEKAVKERLKRKRVKSDMAEGERQERGIARQIERAKKSLAKTNDGDDEGNVAEGESESEEDYLGSDDEGEEREDDDGSKEVNKATGKIAIALQKSAPGPKVNPFEDKLKVNFGFDEEDSSVREKKDEVDKKKGENVNAAAARRSALDELLKEEEKAKRRGATERIIGCAPGLW
jgi:DNA/RNA-binding protein KIN17